MSLYPLHPAALLFPEMPLAEFEQLKADIAANGLHTSVWLNTKGELLDGRHRARACHELGVPCATQTFAGDDEIAFVMSQNFKRRHLDSNQRAMIIARAKALYAERAAAAYAATVGRPKKGNEKKSGKKISQINAQRPTRDHAVDEANKAATAMAADGNTNSAYVKIASRVLESAPDLAPLVDAGTLKLLEVKRIMDAAPEPEARAAVTARALQLNDTRRAVREHVRRERVEQLAAAGPPKSDAVTVLHCKLEDAALAPGSFDLVVTDPPYGISGSDMSRPDQGTLIRDFGAWDHGELPVEAWAACLADAMADGATAYVFCPDVLWGRWFAAFMRLGLTQRRSWCWHKTNPPPKVRQTDACNAFELLVCVSRGRPSTFNWLGQNEMCNVLTGPIAQGADRLGHPTEKPRWLIEKLFDISARPGMRVLDAFAGSGIVGAVARDRNCTCTLIEPDDEHQSLIRARLAS